MSCICGYLHFTRDLQYEFFICRNIFYNSSYEKTYDRDNPYLYSLIRKHIRQYKDKVGAIGVTGATLGDRVKDEIKFNLKMDVDK